MKTPVILSLMLLGGLGCEKSRADYRDDLAGAICREMQGCEKIGPDQKFKNFDDCRTEMSSRYNKLWSAKKCEQRIDATKFGACKTRAVTNACSGNVLDAISFSIECGANDVCVAPEPTP